MFIATESFRYRGEKGEKIVWEKIKQLFAHRKCLIYWRYPIFGNKEKVRKEADILIADFDLGLIVIEVKSLVIDQIVSIEGHNWNYQNFYTLSGRPYGLGFHTFSPLNTYLHSYSLPNTPWLSLKPLSTLHNVVSKTTFVTE